MTQTKRKQIDAIFAGSVLMTGLTATGATLNISTALSTALSTAGRGGLSVPVQVSTTEEVIGLMTGQRVEVYNAQNRKIDGDATQGVSEVYGRVTEAAGVYTLSFFAYDYTASAEVAYAFAASTTVQIEIPYRYDFARLPSNFAIASQQRHAEQDPSTSAAARLYVEQVTVTGLNALANLTKTPDLASNLVLTINNLSYYTIGGAAADFSVAGKVLTWSAANALFNVEVGDKVIAQYTTNE